MTKMKITAVSMGLVAMLLPSMLFAFDMSLVKAYPVPFNPKKSLLKAITIDGFTCDKVKVEVFDINGDPVSKISKTGTITQVTWNGRNDRGTLVKPGLYIIKVTLENEAVYPGTPADSGKKLIRVLITY